MYSKFIIQILTVVLIVSCNATPQKVKEAEIPAVSLPYYQSPDYKPYWITGKDELNMTVKHRLGEFAFMNQDGEVVTQEAVKGKIHVANFFFTTCPSICPAMIGQFERLQDSLKENDNVLLLSYTVDPATDTVACLKAYGQQHHLIKDKWHLLTGNKEELYAIGRTFYFAEKEEGIGKNSEQFLHTENFILVDASGYIRGIYNGTMPEETNRLIKDIRNLELEY